MAMNIRPKGFGDYFREVITNVKRYLSRPSRRELEEKIAQLEETVVGYERSEGARTAELENAARAYRGLVDSVAEKGREIFRLSKEVDSYKSQFENSRIQVGKLEDEVRNYEIRLNGLKETKTELEKQLTSARGHYELWKRFSAILRRDLIKAFADSYVDAHPSEIAVVVDNRDRVVRASKKTLRTIGYSSEEIVGRDVYSLVDNSSQTKKNFHLEIPRATRQSFPCPAVQLVRSKGDLTNPLDLVVVPRFMNIEYLGKPSQLYLGCLVRQETSEERRVREKVADHVPGKLGKIREGINSFFHSREKERSQES